MDVQSLTFRILEVVAVVARFAADRTKVYTGDAGPGNT